MSERKCVGVVEGDDGLFRVSGTIDETIFSRLGFVIKLEHCDSLEDARFCSMCFNVESQRVLCDPVKKLLNTGWTFSEGRFSAKLRKQLLRGKALSLLCESPGCPIIHSFAKYLHRLTSGQARYSGLSGVMNWNEEQLDICEDRITASLVSVPTLSDRLLVEKIYGIPTLTQLAIERYFETCDSIRPIPLGLVLSLLPHNCIRYASGHVFEVRGRPQLWRR